MSGGGSGTQTSTTQQQIPPWLDSAAQGFLGAAGQVAQLPYTPYNDQRVANLSPLQQSSLQGIADLSSGLPSMYAGESMLQGTLNGNYLNGNPAARNQVSAGANPYIGDNPYFSQVQQGALNDIVHNYQTAISPEITRQMNLSGNLGGSADLTARANAQRELAQQLGRTAAGMSSDQYNRSAQLAESGLGRDLNAQQFNANLGSSAYENERNRMMQSIGASTGLYNAGMQGLGSALSAGDIERRQNQSLLDSQYQDFQNWRDYPAQQLGIYGNALGGVMGRAGGSSTTQTPLPPPDRVSQGLGIYALGNSLSRGSSK